MCKYVYMIGLYRYKYVNILNWKFDEVELRIIIDSNFWNF